MSTKTLAVAVSLAVMAFAGCSSAPPNGNIIIHITDNGIVANCETQTMSGETGEHIPPVCSAVEIHDERKGTK